MNTQAFKKLLLYSQYAESRDEMKRRPNPRHNLRAQHRRMLLLVLLFLTACGNKGDLVMPAESETGQTQQEES